MSRNRYVRRAPHGFEFLPQTGRGWCFCGTSLFFAAVTLWIFASPTYALANLTDVQCNLLLTEFKKTFVHSGDGYPQIESCDTRIVRLMWEQQINRVYSKDGVGFDTYNSLRSLPDDQFAKLVINAAAGSLLDSTQTASDDAVMRIRVNSNGHFQRYVLNDTTRVASLQTMLILSIVTLAATWWRISIKKEESKSL
jgi:hypothetical protein